MKIDAKRLIDLMQTLPREAQIEIAKTLLKPVQPQKDKEFDMEQALKIAVQLPPAYRYPVCHCLLQADEIFQGNTLSNDDIANMAGALLLMTQNHGEKPGMPGAKIAHDFVAEMHLQEALERFKK